MEGDDGPLWLSDKLMITKAHWGLTNSEIRLNYLTSEKNYKLKISKLAVYLFLIKLHISCGMT